MMSNTARCGLTCRGSRRHSRRRLAGGPMTDYGTVSFTRMGEINRRDWDIVVRHHEDFYEKNLADEILNLFGRLKGPMLGFQVDRYEHSLQTATRALRDGADEETI